MEAYLRKLLLLFSLCYAVVLITLVSAFMLKILSPRGLGIAGLISMAAGTIVLTGFIRKGQKRFPVASPSQELNSDARKRLMGSIRSMKAYIALLVFALIYGLWSTRGGPMWPRLAGVIVNLCMTAALVSAVRKGERKLK